MSGCGRGDAPASNAPASGRPPVNVEVFPIEQRDLRDSVTIVGSLAPNESVELRPEVSGRIEQIHFREGAHVEEGQILVQLDDAEVRAQLAAARAGYSLAKSSLQRVQQLVESATQTEAELDRARSEYERAVAEVELLEVRLARMTLRAPFSGTVGLRRVSPGDFVSQATLITTIEDVSRLKVEFEVPERALSRISPGSRFDLDLRGSGNGRLSGEVFFISPVVDRATRASTVLGIIESPGERIKPGMFVTVDLTLDTRQGALVVPESAVLSREGRQSIVVIRERDGNQVVEFVAVRLGLRGRGLVQIIPGNVPLEAGVPVVASGVGSIILIPGDRVNPRPLRAELIPPAPTAGT